jgi:anti-sigma regulatory factor (Ser/Thr protein kinase)
MPRPTGYAKLDGSSFQAAQTQPPPRRARPDNGARADLEPDPAAAAQARRLTRDTLARWDLQHLGDDAEAIASELVTNAIYAATQPGGCLPAIIFAIHHCPPELIITVWDNGPGEPRRDAVGPDAESGQGLVIIDTLTGGGWGWWPTPRGGGKVVWAALPVSAPSVEPEGTQDRAR